MSYTYANRKRGENAAPKKESAASKPSMDALRAGLAKPTQEQMGRRVDLPDAMRAKMENAFGADLSAVKLYESEAVADAGANAVAQGSNIAFAPGMLDFTSYGGQALLGHEISHVVSQQRGEVAGSGFLNDHALEARADREGAMAAAGQQIAMPTAALSTVSAAPAAGPMQAKKPPKVSGTEKLDRLQEEAFMGEGSLEQKNKAYMRSMKAMIREMDPKALKEDVALQNRVLADTSRLTNYYMMDKQRQNSQTTFGEYSTAGFRSGVGDDATGAFTAMLTGLMGGSSAINKTLVSGGDNALGKYQNLLTGNERATELLTKFGDNSFKGINLNADQQSNALMNTLYNHASSSYLSEENEDKRDRMKTNAMAAMSSVALNPRTGGYGTKATEKGKGFLGLYKRRFGKS